MHFGLSKAPSTFQCLMERCLGDFNSETALVYLDDIIIFFKTFEDHIKHLDQVFTRMAQYGLKPKTSKCCLMRQGIQYLGHIVEAGGVSPDPAKVQAMQE